MESSFRTRVDRTFGGLLGLNQTIVESESVSSRVNLPANGNAPDVWFVSERAISTARFARTGDDDDGVERDDNAAADYRRFVRLERRGRRRRRDDLTADEPEDEDSEEERRERKRAREIEFEGDIVIDRSEEDDDEEIQEMRRMIGRDCTLDFEEEEDEYDKVAVGREGAGERMYMREVTGSCLEICHLPPGHSGALGTFRRDARANHAAAAARLREDMEGEAMAGTTGKERVPTASPARLPSVSSSISCLKRHLGDEGFAKDGADEIVGKNEKPSEASSTVKEESGNDCGIAEACDVGKSFGPGNKKATESCNSNKDIRESCLKTEERIHTMRKEKKARTVRFAVADDPLEEDRGREAEVSMNGYQMGTPEAQTNTNRFGGTVHSFQNASKVPDYVRNPSKYTHYTLEWSDDEEDVKENLSAFQSFKELTQEKEKLDGAMEPLHSITFIPKFNGTLKVGESGQEKCKKDSVSVQAPSLVSFVEPVVEDDLNCKTNEDLSLPIRSSEGKTARVFRKRTRTITEDDSEKETTDPS
ncbi:hypothetical protein MPTK1_1g22090 [Marchantia polymorpha subsp. ruderalis]|uniref:U5 small nuclear ribonucleoprotein TSSC4 n=2 Tax=Marchantia polymorpha TaxID=3197 RepID=A0A176VDA4_MARPO|nr:hypothetical protein AXG93_436s1320 [Marchantia polymorpha subsp. ruderalis]PTQ50653.1 hypothetical protein MARPO_0001s0546 [Marchantia polymorpha]PTQ50654.1 hypothetical protein MARPO_0001s0546 [Marchantia polymorpha]BBM99566.1 hypothetical protein Mp_1g22090 [Marchantia polymorpha subsp. ruderalis]BBM99567.1 hypothetical protein Mp_1g22090 [Marchantia polymorpha subsp. ruderalis]|eukprot:PTQ50653.1 hypothetical protein MARPO_0001s0546 [Marchantia polymorpha]